MAMRLAGEKSDLASRKSNVLQHISDTCESPPIRYVPPLAPSTFFLHPSLWLSPSLPSPNTSDPKNALLGRGVARIFHRHSISFLSFQEAHFGIYSMHMPKTSKRWPGAGTMQRKAKLFMNNRSQAVRLPKEFQFKAREVFIRKEGNDIILSPHALDWSSYLAEGPVASESYMEGVGDLPVQERET